MGYVGERIEIMPKILMTGENTFRVVEDDYEERVETPTPPISPNPNSPTHQLKRDMLRENPYTKEAASDVMRTPVNYDMGVSPIEKEPYWGKYTPRPASYPNLQKWREGDLDINKYISIDVGDRRAYAQNDPPSTLSHEYTHKRYFEDLDPVTRQTWALSHRNIMGEDFPKMEKEYWGIDEPEKSWADPIRQVFGMGYINREPVEMYAQWAESRGNQVPEEFYPGQFRPPEPPRPAPLSPAAVGPPNNTSVSYNPTPGKLPVPSPSRWNEWLR